MKEDQYRSQFRLPFSLYEKLKIAADEHGESLNKELVNRLERSFVPESTGQLNNPTSESDRMLIAEVEKRAAEWGCSKTQALIRMTIEEVVAKNQ